MRRGYISVYRAQGRAIAELRRLRLPVGKDEDYPFVPKSVKYARSRSGKRHGQRSGMPRHAPGHK